MTGLVLDLLLASVLWSGAALLTESALRLYRQPSRWAWIAALGLAPILPIAARLIPGLTESLPSFPIGALAGIEALGLPSGHSAAVAPSLGLPFGLLWAGGMLVAWWAGARSFRRLARSRARWRPTRATGVRVWRSSRFGPAVVGLRPGRIVLPGWFFGLPTRARRLILVHEAEHARAGDVPLLVCGAILAALVPWNPLSWWQLRRLHAAVEVDCDRRVLSAGVPVAAYAPLLLEFPANYRFLPSPVLAFARPRSLLGRRIDLMTRRLIPSWHRRGRALAAAAGTLALVLVACDAAAPNLPRSERPSVPEAARASTGPAGTLSKAPFVGDTSALALRRVTEADRPARLLEKKAMANGGAQGIVRSSASGGPGPILVVDGVETSKDALQGMSKDRVERVEVLKGPTAVGRYGERARDGVIIITTKR